MLFSKLAQYFEKLEQTSSRLTLIDILSELFKEVNLDEIGHVSYLIQGRVGPFFEPIEIGMAEKNVAASIARAYGVEREEVLKEYGRVGDLGVVSQHYSEYRHSGSHEVADRIYRDAIVHDSKESELQHNNLSVNAVFETLRSIAKMSGEGTVENKVSALAKLLEQVDEMSAKHLVRIPLGSSRLGIGDPTVLDAFALAKLGDRKQRAELEGAYNRTSDLGLIGETLWTKGLEGVKKLQVSFGRPIRSQLCERLPDPKTILEKMGGQAHVQYKYDGFRVQIHLKRKLSSLRGSEATKQSSQKIDRHANPDLIGANARDDELEVRLFSRNLEETTHMLPDIIEGVLQQIDADSVILDSEALAYNPSSEEFLPFQETTKRRRKHGVEEMAKQLPLKAFVFDIMYLNGEALIDVPLTTRLEKLKQTIKGDEVLLPQLGEITNSPERVQELFDDALTKGLEGLIVKRPDSKYEAGARNFNWVKLKRHSSGELKDTIDCVILGYIFGKGKRADFGAGALLVGVYDKEKDEFVTVSKIGTGLTDNEWREIKVKSEKLKVENKPARVNSLIVPSVWVEPKIVIEVLADEITKSPIHTAGASVEGSGKREPGYALRFPRLVGFREEDKLPEDATTVKELVEMYNQQYKK